MIEHFTDTNILLRRIQTGSPERQIARRACQKIIQRGDALNIVPQNLYEFWHAATRPVRRNGLGLDAGQATRKVIGFKRVFHLLPDTPQIYDEWQRIVTTMGITGPLAHDARIVAAMRVHGITHILTFNVKDFQQFPGIVVVDPANV